MKLVAELGPDLVSETEVGRIARDDRVTSESLGLTLDESKRLVAAAQVEIVRAQVAVMGERFRCCEHCGAKLISKGYYPATFRSLFGDVAVRVRRLCACLCKADAQDSATFSALAINRGIAPELAYARNGGSSEQFAGALTRAGVRGHTPAIVLSDESPCGSSTSSKPQPGVGA